MFQIQAPLLLIPICTDLQFLFYTIHVSYGVDCRWFIYPYSTSRPPCFGEFHIVIEMNKKFQNETKALARFAMLLSGALCQLFLWCTYGEMIRSRSHKIAEAVFNTAWYKLDPEYVKMATIVIMRAQKGIEMTACFIMILNMETFVSVS